MTTKQPITVSPAEFPRDKAIVAELFVAYAASLPSHIDLKFQSFEEELSQLPGKYSTENRGAVFLACTTTTDSAGQPAQPRCIGCIAVRGFNTPDTCELKRLYTFPEARGLGAGRILMEAALSKAKELGYKEMLLDTLASMVAARTLYARYGFKETAKYYDNPFEGVVFMRAKLQA